MNKKIIPLTIQGTDERIYAGFWLRLGVLLLDMLIMAPYVFLVIYLVGFDKDEYYLTIIPGFVVYIWYNMYLVRQYGGTPGKLIVGIRILKIDGSDVTWREAILREFVSFVLMIFMTILMSRAVAKADGEYFRDLEWMYRNKYLFSLEPVMYKIYFWASNIWFYSELVVLLLNKRRRALHDFMAGTVIVKRRYVDSIREAIKNESKIADKPE
jgi:uncharacterized RDD family membrane protein YckC